MSIVLLKQYRESDTREQENKRVQGEFEQQGICAIVVPSDISIEWIDDGVDPTHNVAVIKLFGDTRTIRDGAAQLKKDLAEQSIESIILPLDTSIEVMPV